MSNQHYIVYTAGTQSLIGIFFFIEYILLVYNNYLIQNDNYYFDYCNTCTEV